MPSYDRVINSYKYVRYNISNYAVTDDGVKSPDIINIDMGIITEECDDGSCKTINSTVKAHDFSIDLKEGDVYTVSMYGKYTLIADNTNCILEASTLTAKKEGACKLTIDAEDRNDNDLYNINVNFIPEDGDRPYYTAVVEVEHKSESAMSGEEIQEALNNYCKDSGDPYYKKFVK